MPSLFLVSVATFLFENDEFVGFDFAEEGGLHVGAFDDRGAYFDSAVIVLNEEDFVKAEFFSPSGLAIHKKYLVRGDFVLVSADFYNC